MIATVLLSLGGALCVTPATASPADSLREFYQQGSTWNQFYGAVVRRASAWRKNYGYGMVDEETLTRARNLSATWRVLAVTVDGCSDSVNTIPYLASLVDSAGGTIELRIIDPKQGRGLMEAHRTRDGRAATPTLILLDENWNEVGCWVERPSELARWGELERAKLSDREFVRQKTAWYDQDHGRSTVREVLDMIEKSAPGAPCGGNGEGGA